MVSGNHKTSSVEPSMVQPRQDGASSNSRRKGEVNNGGIATNSGSLQALKDDPEAIRFV